MRHHEELKQRALQTFTRAIRRVGWIPLSLIFAWILAVAWGEQSTFTSHISSCAWNNWEQWKSGDNPHHVLLVADPQLVDPHTYPDRPWPLSSLTVVYTDLYLKRAYRRLLKQLQPDSTLFLGDLFDGGREWGTEGYTSPDKQYKQYGQSYWLHEYHRFMKMFVTSWYDSGVPDLAGDGGRRLIASVPGNHDLGFGGGINPAVKSRFDAHFGPLNRVDVMGNHTFVMLDTLSLSAMDQVDPITGATGTGDGSGASSQSANIWKPVKDFLGQASAHRERAVAREVDRLRSHTDFRHSSPSMVTRIVQDDFSADSTPRAHNPTPLDIASFQFPTIVLSHVPFFRSDTADCGPNRERGTSIPISAGYQYQNVLTPLVSKDIVEKLDPSQIAMMYSGDDHDYCEIDHDRFSGRIKEITVKSMSWAMGIRKPGVQLISLWNPVDLPTISDKSLSMPKGTIQNHLCLLPDQLAIFLAYAKLLGFTLVVLIVRAVLWKRPRDDAPAETLPLYNGKAPSSPPLKARPTASQDSTSSTFSSRSLTARKGTGYGGYGNLPPDARSRSASPAKFAETDDWGNPTTQADRAAYTRAHHDFSHMSHLSKVGQAVDRSWIVRKPDTKLGAFLQSVVQIAVPVLTFYMVLLLKDL